MNIAALVSGGVDSSVTIPLLKEQGLEPVIFYIKIGMEDKAGFMDCPSEEDIEIVIWIARKYGCRMEIVDLQKDYWESVVAYTLDAVKKGLTPNPDVMCNLMIKFGVFNDRYGNDFDRISTGHYAGRVEQHAKVFLGTARDHVKDQTYFLGRITATQMKKLMFPLEKLMKREVREMAHKMKLPSAARRDSQGICFLGKINYNDFIRRYVGEKEGSIIELETGKILGQHKGYWFHTIGQRKGLGLGQGPWFVVKKDAQENIIYVSNGYDPQSQYSNQVTLLDFRFITEDPWAGSQEKHPVTFKIRHTPEFTQGVMEQQGNTYLIHSEAPIAGLAPGQFGVVYDTQKKICIGSGVIG
ncbi:MAG: tRNA 2-thiouridine(34) synthase MnmA [Bacteroidales bacterium]|nr:tRNA 2-thiouridine(34) synthase MnmA [Bacteroidales bacterium]MDZ4203872.1 tRNA 2-thiouridine(34) synthase MnmA [Bacteroidales bacterium]